MEQTACEDLKAFERRLTEVISSMQPRASRWRILLLTTLLSCAFAAYLWLTDPLLGQVGFGQSVKNHPWFAISFSCLLLLLFFGIHKRVVAPSIIASRCRQVCADFNMSCDDSGKLILKARPTTP